MWRSAHICASVSTASPPPEIHVELLALSLLPRMLLPHHFLFMVIDGLPTYAGKPLYSKIIVPYISYEKSQQILLVVVILTHVFMTCGIGVPFSSRILKNKNKKHKYLNIKSSVVATSVGLSSSPSNSRSLLVKETEP